MSDNTFKLLSDTIGIEEDILNRIKSSGFTIGRTNDVDKRKTLAEVIEEKGIDI